MPRGSDEFKNVEAIFKADPAKGVKRFYFPHRGTDHLDIAKIERVQNPELKDSVDMTRGHLKDLLETSGEQYAAGVHSRWLFHGAGSTEALESIIDNPTSGFAPLMGLNEKGESRNLWGIGAYFARDASYSVHGGYGTDCLDDDNNRMALLCLVECGLSCVGEKHMHHMPKTHPERRRLHYSSYVDYASNPEIFVVTKGEQAYPAYIIHFDHD